MSNVHWVFVGLGNPGKEYESTRHNVGFQVVDALASRFSVSCTERHGAALVGLVHSRMAQGNTGGKLVIVKPQSFMNRSGEPVQEILNFYKVRPVQLVVIYDDCELEVGRLKLQSGGAHGGHNGIRSIEGSLSTKDFLRIRVGISRPPPGTMELADWVLGRFTALEQTSINTVVSKCVEACVSIAEEGFVRAQNAANKN